MLFLKRTLRLVCCPEMIPIIRDNGTKHLLFVCVCVCVIMDFRLQAFLSLSVMHVICVV